MIPRSDPSSRYPLLQRFDAELRKQKNKDENKLIYLRRPLLGPADFTLITREEAPSWKKESVLQRVRKETHQLKDFLQALGDEVLGPDHRSAQDPVDVLLRQHWDESFIQLKELRALNQALKALAPLPPSPAGAEKKRIHHAPKSRATRRHTADFAPRNADDATRQPAQQLPPASPTGAGEKPKGTGHPTGGQSAQRRPPHSHRPNRIPPSRDSHEASSKEH